jgi:acyl-CoA reductase-like NAD-dependent aldehyde dehydrogenase
VELKRYDHFINGGWVAPASGEYFGCIDPSTGQTFAEIARGNAEGVDQAVEAPAGGYKRSGFGRVDGIEAMRHYTQTKNVVISLD